MHGEDFITVAHELANGDSEAHWRSAVSRAYYGAFHVARQAVIDEGGTVEKGPAAHGEVRNWLLNRPEESLVEAGSNLGDLHGRRIRADYHLDIRDMTRNNAMLEFMKAKIIIEAIRANL